MKFPKGQSIGLRIAPVPNFRNVEPGGVGWYGFSWLRGRWERIEHRDDSLTSTYLSDADLMDFAEDAIKWLRRKP